MLRKTSILGVLILFFAGFISQKAGGAILDTINIARYYEDVIDYKQENGANVTYYAMLDTLKRRLDLASEDEFCDVAYLNGFNFYAKEISVSHPDSAMRMLRKVLVMSQECGIISAEAGAVHELGVLYASHGLNNIAMEYYLRSLDLFENLDDWVAIGYAILDIGNIYFRLNKMDKAREHYIEAEKSFIEGAGEEYNRNLEYALAVCRNNLGLVEMEQGDFEAALTYFREAFEIRRNADFYMYLPHSTLYIARALDSLGHQDSARIEIARALKLDSLQNAGINKGILVMFLGGTYLERDTAQALQYFEKTLDIAKATDDLSLLQEALRGIAACYEGTEPDSALHYYNRVFEIAEEQNNIGLKESIAVKLLGIYEKYNDYEKQNEYLRILNEILHKKLNESVLKSELKAEEKNWQSERMSFLEKIRRQNVFTYSLIILAVLIIAFMIVVITNRLRIKRKSDELERLNLELKRIIDHRDKIYAIIAHDLRGPIGTSKQLLEVIQDPMLSPQQKDHFIDTVKDSISVSYGLLDNLLNWANLKLGNLKLEPEMHELRQLTEDQIKVYSDLVKEKNLQLNNDVRAGSYAFFDYRTVSTVIRNLISNAIKFSEEGKRISIYSISASDMTEIHIVDEGIGMTRETLHKVMSDEEFITKKGTRNESGSGLGLKLCKEYTEINKGKLKVESKAGEGTHFTVQLPVDPGT